MNFIQPLNFSSQKEIKILKKHDIMDIMKLLTIPDSLARLRLVRPWGTLVAPGFRNAYQGGKHENKIKTKKDNNPT